MFVELLIFLRYCVEEQIFDFEFCKNKKVSRKVLIKWKNRREMGSLIILIYLEFLRVRDIFGLCRGFEKTNFQQENIKTINQIEKSKRN